MQTVWMMSCWRYVARFPWISRGIEELLLQFWIWWTAEYGAEVLLVISHLTLRRNLQERQWSYWIYRIPYRFQTSRWMQLCFWHSHSKLHILYSLESRQSWYHQQSPNQGREGWHPTIVGLGPFHCPHRSRLQPTQQHHRPQLLTLGYWHDGP